jgi:hypothetical protein
MAEAYWIVTYQTEDDPKVLGRIREAGGTGDIVGVTSFAACRFEAGLAQRTAVVEFDSLAAAISGI